MSFNDIFVMRPDINKWDYWLFFTCIVNVYKGTCKQVSFEQIKDTEKKADRRI